MISATPLILVAAAPALAGTAPVPAQSLRKVALTFDACMTQGMFARSQSEPGSKDSAERYYNRQIIEILRRTHTKATLFFSGLWVTRYPAIAAELAKDPLFEIGNHGQSHRAFSTPCFALPAIDPGAKALAAEILGTSTLIEKVTSVRPRWFRFPGGCRSKAAVRLAESAGMRIALWDLYVQDGKNQDAAKIVANFRSRLRPSSVVLLHMTGGEVAPKTAEALPLILQEIAKLGYQAVKLSELYPNP